MDETPQTDEAAFGAMVALLEATSAFVEARHAAEDEVLFPSEGSVPFAAIVPAWAQDADTFDEGDYLRTVGFRLVIVVRDESPEARMSKLVRLEAIARNALAGQSYGGFTLYALSTLGRASYPKPRHPEQRAEIPGQFVYEVVGFSGRDATDVLDTFP